MPIVISSFPLSWDFGKITVGITGGEIGEKFCDRSEELPLQLLGEGCRGRRNADDGAKDGKAQRTRPGKIRRVRAEEPRTDAAVEDRQASSLVGGASKGTQRQKRASEGPGKGRERGGKGRKEVESRLGYLSGASKWDSTMLSDLFLYPGNYALDLLDFFHERKILLSEDSVR